MRVAIALGQRLARNLAPILRRQVGEVPVAIRVRVDAREVNPVYPARGGAWRLLEIRQVEQQHVELVDQQRVLVFAA